LRDKPEEVEVINIGYQLLRQGWPTLTHVGPHNSLRTRLRAAVVYTCVETKEEGE